MKITSWHLLSLFIIVASVFSTLRMVFNIIKSAMAVSSARKNGREVIRCESTVYKMSRYIIALLSEGFFTYFFADMYFRFREVKNTFIKLPFLLLVLDFIVLMIIHFIALYKEKYAYLTPDGLISYIKIFRFSNCRFAWETTGNNSGLSNTLHVYPKKEKFPFTVVFYNDIDAAHMIVDNNSIM